MGVIRVEPSIPILSLFFSHIQQIKQSSCPVHGQNSPTSSHMSCCISTHLDATAPLQPESNQMKILSQKLYPLKLPRGPSLTYQDTLIQTASRYRLHNDEKQKGSYWIWPRMTLGADPIGSSSLRTQLADLETGDASRDVKIEWQLGSSTDSTW